MELPPGLTSRPLRMDDARAVFELMAAQELVDLGSVEIEEADIVADWSRPSYDVGTSALGVFAGDRMVGYVEVSGGDRGDAAVHPGLRGRGIGTALAQRMQQLARDRGATVVGMPVPVGSPGDQLLESLGYRVRWTSWLLELPHRAEVPPRPLPAGYLISEATPEQHRDAWTVVEDAFLEWSERERQSYEDFAATVQGRPGFEPWHLRAALDPDGRVAGVSHLSVSDEGFCFVLRLAVRREQRRRGLAQALLADSFRAGREHGSSRFQLSTDSRTGALGLYEKVGMEVTSTWVNRAIDLC
ncbi:GNAT family N-acetyltransferase [Nocardioides houyundeii]|uniref:GNAT family N-acetyltransferase n=1 Tax=Nocardioides houyundeii TaxID=2045452 RepID=UPI000DF3AAE7|nr:GNAT family N-acetyltransferase [Nocardioides houyundeii]